MILVYAPSQAGTYWERCRLLAAQRWPGHHAEGRNLDRLDPRLPLEVKGVHAVILPEGQTRLAQQYRRYGLPVLHVVPDPDPAIGADDSGPAVKLPKVPAGLITALLRTPTPKLLALVGCLNSPAIVAALMEGEARAQEGPRLEVHAGCLRRFTELTGGTL